MAEMGGDQHLLVGLARDNGLHHFHFTIVEAAVHPGPHPHRIAVLLQQVAQGLSLAWREDKAETPGGAGLPPERGVLADIGQVSPRPHGSHGAHAIREDTQRAALLDGQLAHAVDISPGEHYLACYIQALVVLFLHAVLQ